MSFLTSASTPAENLNNTIINGAIGIFHALTASTTYWFNLIWHNHDQANLSPDKAWAALGTNAVSVRASFGATVSFLNAIAPGALALTEPTDWTITQNSDGTITAVKNS